MSRDIMRCEIRGRKLARGTGQNSVNTFNERLGKKCYSVASEVHESSISDDYRFLLSPETRERLEREA